jgi:hypothetical protein
VDWWKVVIIVVLLVIVVAALATVVGQNFGASEGRASISQLARPGEDTQGNHPDWSPFDVARQLFPMLLSTSIQDFNVFTVLMGAFGAAFVVVGIAILLKIVFKITGG